MPKHEEILIEHCTDTTPSISIFKAKQTLQGPEQWLEHNAIVQICGISVHAYDGLSYMTTEILLGTSHPPFPPEECDIC